MIPVAHIAGFPVEETLGALGPALGAMLAALGATTRTRVLAIRRTRRSRPCAGGERR
jgi:hypothetical protein